MKSKTPKKRRSREVEAEDGTLTDRAYRELEEMIVTLQLKPATVLSEQALAQRLKIGRTPIREALQRLARDGLVVIMPRRGIMVSEINLRLQLRLLEVRRELERLMASLAAERATPEERHEFAEVAEAMLAAVARLARSFALPCQVALEEFMACAVGGCAGCTVAVTTALGTAMKRVCVDGPVFDAATVFPT